MRTVAVIVTSELGRNLAEMPLAKDQHVVQALTAQRADEPLREAVGLLRRQHSVRVNGLRHRVVAGARGLGADRLRLPRGDRPRFGDIFRTNATKAGLLPVILPEAIVSALQDAVEADPGTEVTVDLGRREVRAGAAGRRARAVRAARRAQLGRRARAARRARRGSGLRSRSTNIPAGG